MVEAMIETRVLIIGSGPAGLTAAIYAARAGLKSVVLAGNQEGGQLMITTDVENYPGFERAIMGPDLMQQMKLQAQNVGAEIRVVSAVEVNLDSRPFRVVDDRGEVYVAEAIIIATGAVARWLGVKGEKELQGAGVSACATCDGAFFKNQRVAVVGGGNTAVEEALFLTRHAERVFLIHRRDKLRAEKILQDKLFANNKIEMIWDSVVMEMVASRGDDIAELEGVRIRKTDEMGGEESVIAVSGLFVAIGHNPETSLFRGKLDMDGEGYIITRADSTETNVGGVYAAGDVSDRVFRQAVTAAGLGCMAALEAQALLD